MLFLYSIIVFHQSTVSCIVDYEIVLQVEHFIILDSGMKIEMNQIVSIEEGTY